VTLTDPLGLLQGLQEAVTPTPDVLLDLRQQVDVARWVNIYGGLPLPETRTVRRMPLQQEG
jgi:hypothetical protein